MKIKKFTDDSINEELSNYDYKKIDAILRKAYNRSRKEMVLSTVDEIEKALKNYRLSDDVKKYLQEEIEYEKEYLKRYEEWTNDIKKRKK